MPIVALRFKERINIICKSGLAAFRFVQSFFPLLSFCEGLYANFCFRTKKDSRFNKVYLTGDRIRNQEVFCLILKAYTLFFATTEFLAPGAAASPKRSEGYSEAWEQTLIVATALALQKRINIICKSGIAAFRFVQSFFPLLSFCESVVNKWLFLHQKG